MNIPVTLDQLLKQAAALSTSERLQLASLLIQGVKDEIPLDKKRPKWKDIAGLLPYPALDEDAQTYISRSRHADDQHRTLMIRDGE